MKIAYVVLRDLAWKKTRRPSLYALRMTSRLLPVWAETFRMPWGYFRGRLDDIRQGLLDTATGYDAVVELESHDFHLIRQTPGWLVVHSDEDDWHHPAIANAIREVAEPGLVIRWDYCEIAQDGTRRPIGEVPENTGLRFNSCNFAAPTPHVIPLCDYDYNKLWPASAEKLWAGYWSVRNLTIGSMSPLPPTPHGLIYRTGGPITSDCPDPVFARPHAQLVTLHEELLASRRDRFRNAVIPLG